MRSATISRKTGETNVSVQVNLDGSGTSDISTGIGFLDHMLDLLARHSLIDISVKAKGDLEVDFHHTAEDIGIGLGQAVKKALGDKKGIAIAHNNIAIVYHAKGELDKTLEFYKNSLNIVENIGDKKCCLYSYCGLAETLIGLGDFQKALENLEKALAISIEIDVKGRESISYRLLGMVFREKGDLDLAIEMFEKARNIHGQIDDKMELARLSYEYGLLFKSKDEPGKAKEHLEKTLSMFEEMGMKLWADKTQKVLEELKQ